MQPTSGLANSVGTLVAADTAFLAAAGATKLHLAKASFTPSLTLTTGGLTEAAFVGYAAITAGATGTQATFFDPATGGTIVEVKAPVGGWLFKCTGATGLPETEYGYYLTDNAGTGLLASALFPSPITITATGQGIEVANARLSFPASPMT